MSHESLVYGLDWLSVERAADARKRAIDGVTLPIAWVVLRNGGHTLVGRAPADQAGGISAAAVWAAAIGDGAIIEALPDGRFWMALAAEGIPVPGYDFTGSENEVRDKLGEALSIGIDSSRIFGTVAWEEIPPTEQNQKAFGDFAAMVPPKTMSRGTLRAYGRGAGRGGRRWLIGLLVLALLVGGGTLWLAKHKREQEQKLLQAAAAAAASAQRARSDGAEKAAAERAKAIAAERVDMQAAWARSGRWGDAEAFLFRAATFPSAMAGFRSTDVKWTPSAWTVDWTAGTDAFDTAALQGLGASFGASQTCSLWVSKCTWTAPGVGSGTPAPSHLADASATDRWMAQVFKVAAFRVTSAPPQSWPLLGVVANNYQASGAGLDQFLEMQLILSNAPHGVRVTTMDVPFGMRTWRVGFQVWGR